jgi:hypothetical protein
VTLQLAPRAIRAWHIIPSPDADPPITPGGRSGSETDRPIDQTTTSRASLRVDSNFPGRGPGRADGDVVAPRRAARTRMRIRIRR